MNIVLICASMRSNSQSLKVAQWLDDELNDLKVNTDLVDLHKLNLPMFDDGETKSDAVKTLRDRLEKADGFIFISPEWNGMMSHGLINMLHYIKHEMAHKPVMLVGVSSGRGGTYPVAQMRFLGHKNRHYVLSPESLIVSDVKNVLNDHSFKEESSDISQKKRAVYALKILLEYASALQQVRESGVVDLDSFPNGV